MVRIQLSPDVRDYFVTLDWNDSSNESFTDKLTEHYERGDVILLKNPPFKIDYVLINRIKLPAGRLFQKTTDRFFLYPNLLNPAEAAAFRYAFGADLPFYLKSRREIVRVSRDVRAFARKAFPHYRYKKYGLTWRMTETPLEDLHLDGYGIDADLQYMRIFINLDAEPRRWNVSHRLDELVPLHYHAAGMAGVAGQSADSFNKKFNLHVFGGKTRIGTDGYPRHSIEFEQGDVWLCDSRLVSHQIVWGRRLLATHFQIDPASMLHPELSLERKVQSYHRLYGAGV